MSTDMHRYQNEERRANLREIICKEEFWPWQLKLVQPPSNSCGLFLPKVTAHLGGLNILLGQILKNCGPVPEWFFFHGSRAHQLHQFPTQFPCFRWRPSTWSSLRNKPGWSKWSCRVSPGIHTWNRIGNFADCGEKLPCDKCQVNHAGPKVNFCSKGHEA